LTISEGSRHALHSRLVEVLGQQEAVVLMEHLPPVGWADVATKRDLDHVAVELRGEMVELRGEMAELRGEMLAGFGQLRYDLGAQTRGMYLALLATVVSLVGAMAAVAAIAR
jgi:hypothetical protein